MIIGTTHRRVGTAAYGVVERLIRQIKRAGRNAIPIGRSQVLILDDSLLMKVSNDTQLAIIFNFIMERKGLKTTIVCSQFFPEGWQGQLGGTSALA